MLGVSAQKSIINFFDRQRADQAMEAIVMTSWARGMAGWRACRVWHGCLLG